MTTAKAINAVLAKTDKPTVKKPVTEEPFLTALSEIGQLIFRPECSRCSWRGEAYTCVEGKALAEKHRDETGHRPIPIFFDSLRNFMMSVT